MCRVGESERSATVQVCCGDDAVQCRTCDLLHDVCSKAADVAAGARLGVDWAGPGDGAACSNDLGAFQTASKRIQSAPP